MDDCIGGVGAKGGTGCAGRDEAAAQTTLQWLEFGREPGTYTLPGIESARSTKHPKSTNKTRLPSLTELYEQIIHAAGPGAQLLVVGYPELFETAISPAERCQVGTVLGLDKLNIAASDVEWIDARAAQLDEVISDSVANAIDDTGANITYVDPRPAFFGGVVCDERAQEDVNALLFKSFSWNVEEESFHPTQTGQNLLAEEIIDNMWRRRADHLGRRGRAARRERRHDAVEALGDVQEACGVRAQRVRPQCRAWICRSRRRTAKQILVRSGQVQPLIPRPGSSRSTRFPRPGPVIVAASQSTEGV